MRMDATGPRRSTSTKKALAAVAKAFAAAEPQTVISCLDDHEQALMSSTAASNSPLQYTSGGPRGGMPRTLTRNGPRQWLSGGRRR